MIFCENSWYDCVLLSPCPVSLWRMELLHKPFFHWQNLAICRLSCAHFQLLYNVRLAEGDNIVSWYIAMLISNDGWKSCCMVYLLQPQSQIFSAEKPIYSKLEADDTFTEYGPALLSLWVYETDLQSTDKEVYKSNMTWPNNQQEVVYICLGMEAFRPADKRCKSSNVTVFSTDNFFRGRRVTTLGTLRRLSVTGHNDFLTQKEIEERGKICNSKCQGKKNTIIVASTITTPFGAAIIIFIIVTIVVKCKRRKLMSNTTLNNTSSSAPSRRPYYGRKFLCSYVTVDTMEESTGWCWWSTVSGQ